VDVQILECNKIDMLPVDRTTRSFNKGFAANLAVSIQAEGLYNPIVVRPSPDKPGRYVLVQGRHRLYATFKVLKEQSIRATILEDMDEAEHKMALVAENIWRFDTSKIQRLKAIQIWHEHYAARHAKDGTTAAKAESSAKLADLGQNAAEPVKTLEDQTTTATEQTDTGTVANQNGAAAKQ